jgi:hypothetical protein
VLRDGGELRTEIDGKQVSVPADGWDQLTADINRREFYAAQLEPEELAELRQDAAALDRLGVKLADPDGGVGVA